MSPTLRYTSSRLLLFVVSLLICYAIGLRGLLCLAVAAIASGALSWFLLARQRAELSGRVESRLQRISAKLDERTRAEDFEPGDYGQAEPGDYRPTDHGEDHGRRRSEIDEPPAPR